MFSFCPRAHSVSDSAPLSRTSGESKVDAKQGSPLVEGRRNRKRRCQDGSVLRLTQSSSSMAQWSLIPSVDMVGKTLETFHNPPTAQSSRLATTSAEFNLFPKRPHKHENGGQRKFTTPLTRSTISHDDLADLVHLRSTAFWELRRSIAENGEGLVRRMRDFERSRSRHHVHRKAKEAEKRGRKRNSPRSKRRLFPMPSSEDEDVQICSGDSSIRNVFLSSCHAKLDGMDVDNYPLEVSCAEAPQHELALEDGQGLSPSISEFDHSFPPSLSHSACESPNSSTISLPLSAPSNPKSPDSWLSPSFPSTASDKAIAVMNLALANGAAGLNDYSNLLEFQDKLQLDVYDNGDLWH